jgi:hypothetical protein
MENESAMTTRLKREVDGEHFWDAVAEDAAFEFLYEFAGFPRKIVGRKKIWTRLPSRWHCMTSSEPSVLTHL